MYLVSTIIFKCLFLENFFLDYLRDFAGFVNLLKNFKDLMGFYLNKTTFVTKCIDEKQVVNFWVFPCRLSNLMNQHDLKM